jgi:hypothetical protein
VQALEIYHKQTQKGKHKIEYMSQDSYQNGINQQLSEVIQKLFKIILSKKISKRF